MTITYNFTSRRADTAHYVFDIGARHAHLRLRTAGLVALQDGKGTFTAQVLNGDERRRAPRRAR